MLRLFILISMVFVPGYANGTTNSEQRQEEVSSEQERKQWILWQGINSGNYDVVRDALRNGADPNTEISTTVYSRDYELPYLLPLMRAVSLNRVEIVELLLKAGANPNIYREISPLQSACAAGNIDVAMLLMEAGADIVQIHKEYGKKNIYKSCESIRPQGGGVG